MKNSIGVAAFHCAKRYLTYIIWETLNDVTFTNGALHRLCFSKSYHNHNWYKYLYFLTIFAPFLFDRKQHKGKVRLCRITPDFLHSGRELLLKIATSWTHKFPPTCLTQKKKKNTPQCLPLKYMQRLCEDKYIPKLHWRCGRKLPSVFGFVMKYTCWFWVHSEVCVARF